MSSDLGHLVDSIQAPFLLVWRLWDQGSMCDQQRARWQENLHLQDRDLFGHLRCWSWLKVVEPSTFWVSLRSTPTSTLATFVAFVSQTASNWFLEFLPQSGWLSLWGLRYTPSRTSVDLPWALLVQPSSSLFFSVSRPWCYWFDTGKMSLILPPRHPLSIWLSSLALAHCMQTTCWCFILLALVLVVLSLITFSSCLVRVLQNSYIQSSVVWHRQVWPLRLCCLVGSRQIEDFQALAPKRADLDYKTLWFRRRIIEWRMYCHLDHRGEAPSQPLVWFTVPKVVSLEAWSSSWFTFQTGRSKSDEHRWPNAFLTEE